MAWHNRGAASVVERALVFDCRSESLVGILHEPDAMLRELAVLVVVGGPQYRVGSHRQFVLMSRRLASSGYAVLRFDYRGMGDSTGSRRAFETVDDDIRAAIDALLGELRTLRGVIVFGLCDAASAALMYCRTDPRVEGLVLANPWTRTEAGQARTQVRHYYGQRLLTRSFWGKVFTGRFDASDSLRGFISALRRSAGGATGTAGPGSSSYIDRMLAGLTGFVQVGRPVLLLMSGRDLTAREFDDLCRSSQAWAAQVAASSVRRVDLPYADHTFSDAEALEKASAAVLEWLPECAASRRN